MRGSDHQQIAYEAAASGLMGGGLPWGLALVLKWHDDTHERYWKRLQVDVKAMTSS